MLLEKIGIGVAIAILCYVVFVVSIDIINQIWR